MTRSRSHCLPVNCKPVPNSSITIINKERFEPNNTEIVMSWIGNIREEFKLEKSIVIGNGIYCLFTNYFCHKIFFKFDCFTRWFVRMMQ